MFQISVLGYLLVGECELYIFALGKFIFFESKSTRELMHMSVSGRGGGERERDS